jgi:hypothetical protein
VEDENGETWQAVRLRLAETDDDAYAVVDTDEAMEAEDAK